MADKQLARSGTADFKVLADDDPLAELARIVGYDNRPAVQQLQELEKHRDLVRREPVMNLEDELLREFDVYDAPTPAPAVSLADTVPEEVPLPFDTVQADGPATFEPGEPVAIDYQEELLQTPSPEWDMPAAEIEPVSQEADVFEPAALEQASVQASVHEPEFAAAPQADWAMEEWDQQAFDGAALERELELSIGSDEPVEVDRAEALPQHVQHFEPEAEPVAEVAPIEESFPSAGDDSFLETASFESAVETAPEQAHPADEQAIFELPFEPSQQDEAAEQRAVSDTGDVFISPADPHGIDALLADIERFPVPVTNNARVSASPDTGRKVNFPFTPTFSRATPVASNGGVLSQKAFATPLPAAVPVAVPFVATQTAYQPAAAEPVVVEAAETLTPPVDAEPDFDIDSFEMDLSGIDLDIDPAEFETAAQETAFAPVQPAMAKPAAVDLQQAAAAFVPAMEQIEEEPESVLPFDPSMISEPEESLVAMAELNVPQLPVVEQERPVAQQPDYDLDIDAEMAQLFGTPSRSARGTPAEEDHAFGSVAAPKSPAVGNARPEDDFEEFEKAMEEDFRQSLTQGQQADPAADRLAVGSGYAAENQYDDEQAGIGKRRRLLLAATVACIAIFGGAGVYAFLGGDGIVQSGGEPKIILADKTPVKVVPVEKGGKTVPNQDKAVYDRVAGTQDTAPQQDALVSSTEEPIDVVQRTLTPEDLPLEGRADDLPGLTPLDDDGADRLLPEGQAAENAADADPALALSPRKVRTMIVKPDGTLVAREEPTPTEVASADAGPATQTVKTTTIAPASQTGATPQAQQVEKSALAQAAEARVEETAPVRSVKTTAVGDGSPVPQARPTGEQAKPVDTFKTEQAQPAVEAKPVETASIAPGTYVIQIASLPSEAEAQKSYNTLSGRYAGVIGGKGVDIKKAEIAGKGTYFRVRIPAGTRDEANALCSRYKSAGGSCLVTR